MSLLEGLRNQDFRFNPISRVFVPETITAENHICGLIPNMGGVYGFQLHEIPLKESPSTVIVTRDSDSLVFTEVVDTDPVGSEFYVDYHYDTYANRGYVILNSSQNGQTFTVQYKGIGSVMSAGNTAYIEQLALDSKLSRDGSLPMLGNLNANSNKIVNLASGTNPQDVVNKGQLDAVSAVANNIQSQKGIYSTTITVDGNTTITDDRYYYEIKCMKAAGSFDIYLTGIPNIDNTSIILRLILLGYSMRVYIHGSLAYDSSLVSNPAGTLCMVSKLSGVWTALVMAEA